MAACFAFRCSAWMYTCEWQALCSKTNKTTNLTNTWTGDFSAFFLNHMFQFIRIVMNPLINHYYPYHPPLVFQLLGVCPWLRIRQVLTELKYTERKQNAWFDFCDQDNLQMMSVALPSWDISSSTVHTLKFDRDIFLFYIMLVSLKRQVLCWSVWHTNGLLEMRKTWLLLPWDGGCKGLKGFVGTTQDGTEGSSQKKTKKNLISTPFLTLYKRWLG